MDEQLATSERNALFQKLKPFCVKISQLAIREAALPNVSGELLDLTNQVLDILNGGIQQYPLALDEKLAEYVFFPLYHIFRQLDQFPTRLIENCVSCLHLLIKYGWKSKITPKLVQQIFSLLVFIIDGVPGSHQKERDVSEELLLEAFQAQFSLLTTAGASANAIAVLTDEDTMPALGHGITVMLDGARDGVNPQIQVEALRTLQALYKNVKDKSALATFLPGTMSSMVKIVSSPSRHKATVLVNCLLVVQTVLNKLLGDINTRALMQAGDREEPDQGSDEKGKVLTPAWLRATASQIKLALSALIKLRTHSSHTVRDALERLCVSLLDECHSSLSNCTSILVETAIVLDTGEDASLSMVSTQTNLRHLVNIYPELGDAIKTAVYGWMSSLARIMQAEDEGVKRVAVRNLSKGIELLHDMGIESSTLEDSIGTTLRDTIVSLIQSSKPVQPTTHLQLLDGSQNQRDSSREQNFEPILMRGESQRQLRQEVKNLICRIGSTSLKLNLAARMMDHVRGSIVEDRIASMWLCYELMKAENVTNSESDEFLDLSAFAASSDNTEPIFEDAFAYSLEVLESHANSEATDWRLEAIALEVVSYAAKRLGTSFRPDLMDVLFPVATFLGSDNTILQQHAIASLNSIALSCEYASVSELIIDNVDYMVNSVSLRLNSLDISPASMQVLTMMMRLSGPRLIPYLNDVVESIFTALDNYHGYTAFTENLFSVLKEIVDQASGTGENLLTEGERKTIDHRKKPEPILDLDDLRGYLERRKSREARDQAEEESLNAVQGHPKEPWKSETPNDEEEEHPPPEPEKPPNSTSYKLLVRIASLTQHYLTSPTPKLRRSLLELLSTAATVLAGDEDSFLPLVNDIWPVVIERLRDPEPFISIEACRTLSSLCSAAGDFLSTRFKTEWGRWLREWCSKVKKQAEAGSRGFKPRPERGVEVTGRDSKIVIPIRSGESLLDVKAITVEPGDVNATSGSLGQHASPVKLWEAATQLLTAIVTYVRIDEDMFDDILDMLMDLMERNAEVREALENINADAVWLARYRKGRVEILPTPVMDGVQFVDMELLPRGDHSQ